MPVGGNEERGAFSRMQSSDYSGGMPIKKRRFPVIFSEEAADLEKNNLESSPSQGSSINAALAAKDGSPGESDDFGKNLVSQSAAGRENTGLGSNVKLEEVKPCGTFDVGSKDDVGSQVNVVVNERKSDRQNEELGNHKIVFAASVSKGVLGNQDEANDCKLKLSTSVPLPMIQEVSTGPVLQRRNSLVNCQVPDNSDMPTLSLSLSKENLVSEENSCSSILNNESTQVCGNRSNWDLNTTMDVWEGSANDGITHDTIGIAGLDISNKRYIGPSISTDSLIGYNENKGKQVMRAIERGPDFHSTLAQHRQLYKPEDSLGLSLATPSRELHSGVEHSSLTAKADSRKVCANANSPKIQLPNTSMKSAARSIVKSEPVDESTKQDLAVGASNPMELLGAVKKEVSERCSSEIVLPPTTHALRLLEQRAMKSELVQESNKVECKNADAVLTQTVRQVVQRQESSASSSISSTPVNSQNQYASRLPAPSEMSPNGELSNQSEHSFRTEEVSNTKDIREEPTAALVMKLASQEIRHSKVNCNEVKNTEFEESEKGKCKLICEQNVKLHGEGECAGCDEENIDISADITKSNSFVSNSECEGANAIVDCVEIQEGKHVKGDEEYEDGEVRESVLHSTAENSVAEGNDAKKAKLSDSDCRNSPSLDPPCDHDNIDNNISEFAGATKSLEDHDGGDINHIEESVETGFNDSQADLGSSLQKSLENTADVEKGSSTDFQEKSLDSSQTEALQEGCDKEVSAERLPDGSHGTVMKEDEAAVKDVEGTSPAKERSTLPKAEESLKVNDVAKGNSGGNRSRIINLSRSSNVEPSSKSRSGLTRLLPSQSGRERYCALEGDKLRSRWNRDEIDFDRPHKFVRDRFHDQSFRNSKPNFMLGRGRGSGRFDHLRGEWNSSHDYASESYNDSSDYRVARHKHSSSMAEMGYECNNYDNTSNGTSLGSRRKVLNDELLSARHPSSRRFSAGDREGQMLRRIPRNISPIRCSDESVPTFLNFRHGEKSVRGLSDDNTDSVFPHRHSLSNELDGQLVRGNRNFSAMERRGVPRIRSKSPVGARTRSPGPWSSPRRRSPDGHPELTQYRPPAVYRVGRVRSPNNAGFPVDMVPRRRGSSSYLAHSPNDTRDVDSGRQHIHPRSVNSNRSSPSDRAFLRSTRRVDVLTPRERPDSDEYFSGHAHSNRYHEFRGDGSSEESRKFGGGRGPLRSFRSTFSDDSDSFNFHLNDGPRPFRFCPEGDTDFIERSNMRDREFDGHIKHQPLIVPRRMRIDEQQDRNYRPSGRIWSDDEFDDVSKVKRRRF